jgi:SNF2 family DNA or RNA helicase
MKRSRAEEDDNYEKNLAKILNDNLDEELDDENVIDYEKEVILKDKDANAITELRDVSETIESLFTFSETSFTTIKPDNNFFKKQYPLQPFQLDGLAWMLSREGYSIRQYDNIPKNWSTVINSDNEEEDIFFNKETGVESVQPIVEGKSDRVKPLAPPLNPVYGGILADEMGLGKTIQTLALICTHIARLQDEQENRIATIIVCPLTLLYQWGSEIAKFTQGIQVFVQHGSARKGSSEEMKRFCEQRGRLNVVLTSYDTLRIDVDNGVYDNVKFLRICCDEAHVMRNFERKKSDKPKLLEYVMRIDAKYHWALTGTPIQNRYADFFALLKFLRVRPFGEFQAWYRLIEYPLVNYTSGLHREALQLLRDLSKTLVLRRTKLDEDMSLEQKQLLQRGAVVEINKGLWRVNALGMTVFKATNIDTQKVEVFPYVTTETGKPPYKMLRNLVPLPPKKLTKVLLQMSSTERQRYDKLKNEARIQFDKETFNITSALTFLLRLRQETLHTLLTTPKGFEQVKQNPQLFRPSSKIAWVVESINKKLQKDPSAKFLIFSLFTGALDLMAIELAKKGWITCQQFANKILDNEVRDNDKAFCRIQGSMKADKRMAVVELFQTKPNLKLLLCSITATAVGLNLTAANYVYFLDLTYNPQLHAQAIDRAHRIGQTRPVEVVFVLMEDTIDDKIYELMSYKDSLSKSLLKPVQLGKEKILQLLK